MKFASALNRRATAAQVTSSTRTKMWVRAKVIIGSSNFSELKLLFSGTVHLDSGETNINDYLIEKVALEKQTGGAAFTPVYFGGSRSVTVTSGTTELLSDAILPSAFSLANFARDSVYWARMLISVAPSASFPRTSISAGTDESTLMFNPVTCGVSDVDGTGVPSYTTGTGGTGPSDFNFAGMSMPLVVGLPIGTGGVYIAGIGDSIVQGADDVTAIPGGGVYKGFFARSLVDSDFVSNVRAGCNFAVYGSSGSMWTTAPVSKMLLKYANVTVEEYGTNTPTYSWSAAIWAAAKAEGHYVVRTKLLTQTSSSDAWATTANQTKNANYTTPTGNRIIFNGDIAAQSGILYDAFVSFDTDVLHTDRDLWKAPGYTADGLHPTSLAHEAMATRLRTAYAAIVFATVNWTISSPTVNSDAGTVTLVVTLDAPAPGGGFSGLVNTYDITALAGVDYTAQVNVPFSISAGNTTGNIVIPILP
jgi:hypothetical protein